MGVPTPNDAMVSWRRVPNRSSVGFSYKGGSGGFTEESGNPQTRLYRYSTRDTLLRQGRYVNPAGAIDLWPTRKT